MSANRFSSARTKRRRQRRLLMVGLLALAAVVVVLALGSGWGAGTASDTAPGEASRTDDAPSGGSSTQAAVPETTSTVAPETTRDEVATRFKEPDSVRGIYLTSRAAGSDKLDTYIELAREKEINAFVIDVKAGGKLAYPSDVPLAQEVGATTNLIPDLGALVERLHSEGIYTIARLTVFKDGYLPQERPEMAIKNSATGGIWTAYNGATWADPYDKQVWEYNTKIAKEAVEAGFDEIQFDYVRFPTDGPMAQLAYDEKTYPTKTDAIGAFLEYAYGELHPMGVEVGADVFGLTATSDNQSTTIGQSVLKMAPHLDVISPMVYPSHYPYGSYGYELPNARPYDVVKAALGDFHAEAEVVNPELEIRPWLQDFTLGNPPYGAGEVRAQIQATYDIGSTGWMLWNAANVYTAGALEPEGSGGPPEKTQPETTSESQSSG